jgi:hypothetical protein
MDYGLRITGTVTDAVAAGTYRLSENVRLQVQLLLLVQK